jgi:hypothetical protein
MASIAHIQNQNLPHQPYTITKEIFAALGPLEKAAALALEKYGYVRIVETIENASSR